VSRGQFDPSPELLARLYRAAWGLCGSPHDAEDLVQDAFARVLARPRALRGDPGPYLFRTLRNTYLTNVRTASRRPRTTELPLDESTPMESSLASADVAFEQQEVLTAIGELPEEFRSVLVAVDIVGLSYREAARLLRVREATIGSRLFRARERLVRLLAVESGERAAPR
jgi:RNA polymerase sigma-70 factor (ECF subfamily)